MATTTTTSARPELYDQDVMANVVEMLLPEVMEWLTGIKGATSTGNEKSGLLDALSTVIEWDGYALAKELEETCYWMPDAQLVAILDQAQGKRYEAHRQAVIRWVKESQGELRFAKGQRVSLFLRPSKELTTGQVVSVNPDLLTLVVCVPPGGPAAKRYIIEQERCTLVDS